MDSNYMLLSFCVETTRLPLFDLKEMPSALPQHHSKIFQILDSVRQLVRVANVLCLVIRSKTIFLLAQWLSSFAVFWKIVRRAAYDKSLLCHIELLNRRNCVVFAKSVEMKKIPIVAASQRPGHESNNSREFKIRHRSV